MRNVILITRVLGGGIVRRKCFVDLNQVIGVDIPVTNTFKIHLANIIWEVSSEDYERLMHLWAPYYKDLEGYQEYINTEQQETLQN